METGEGLCLALYAASHLAVYRRIESLAKVKESGKLRVLDLKRLEVQDTNAAAEDAEVLSGAVCASYNCQ
jgi:hypothetical protein